MIPLTRPLVDFAEVAEDFRTVVESGTPTSGAFVAGFEADVARYAGTAHAVATTLGIYARMGGEVVEQVVAQLRRVIEGGA